MSADRYVRIPTSALSAVQLRHVISEKDSTIAALQGGPTTTVITGMTEWVGSWREEALSVGWDWGVVDGLIVLINPSEIRTNIQLISSEQRPERLDLAQIHFLHWIESHPWREVAVSKLLGER